MEPSLLIEALDSIASTLSKAAPSVIDICHLRELLGFIAKKLFSVFPAPRVVRVV